MAEPSKINPFEEEETVVEKTNPFEIEEIPVDNSVVETEAEKANPFEESFVSPEEYTENNIKEANKIRVNAYHDLLDRDPEELKTAELPVPNLSMYEGLTFNDAVNLYTIYNRNENTRFGLLGRAYKSEDKTSTIPFPDEDFFGDDYGAVDADGKPIMEKGAGVALGDKALFGVNNALKWIAVTGAAGIDYLGDKIASKTGDVDIWDEETQSFQWDYLSPEDIAKAKEEDPNYGSLASTIDKNWAEANPGDSIADTLVVEGTGLLVGGAGAFKLADKALKYAPKLPGIFKGLAKFTSVEAGMSAALSPEVGTVFLGDNSLFNTEGTILEGVDVDPNDPQYQQILDKKLNIFMDGMLIAKPAEGIIKSSVWMGKGAYNLVIDPFVKLGSRSAREKEVVKQILDQLTIAANPQKYGVDEADAKKELVRLIKENQEVIIKMTDDEEIRLGLDTMGALEKGLADNIGDERVAAIISNARKQRSGALSGGEASQLEVTTARPSNTLDDLTSQTDEILSEEKMLDSADAIAQQGLGEIATAKSLVDDLTQQIADANGDVLKVLESNPVLDTLTITSIPDTARCSAEIATLELPLGIGSLVSAIL